MAAALTKSISSNATVSIKQWREKLGLKRAQYAKLLDVSPLSVTHWESGSTVPRETQKRRIAELRDLGKRELKKLCMEKGIKLRKNSVSDAD